MKTFNTLITIGILSLLGCAADEDEIQAEFDSYVAARQSCEDDGDCALVYPGCPLGCYVVVATVHVNDVKHKAEELIDDYERGGSTCDYSCLEPPIPICPAGRCEAGVPGDGGVN